MVSLMPDESSRSEDYGATAGASIGRCNIAWRNIGQCNIGQRSIGQRSIEQRNNLSA